MGFEIENTFSANVIFESSIAIDGYSYLIIYGKHINGYYCCIPAWKWGCEMSSFDNVSYNIEKLMECGARKNVARGIAKAIEFIVSDLRK